MHPYGGVPACPKCEKNVYAAEQIMGPGRMLYHKPCLACFNCHKRLDSLSLMEHDKEPYCKQCYTRCFGPQDLRQANLPHRDDRLFSSPRSSPIRMDSTGSPNKSFGNTSPTQEEINVEAEFERAKRRPSDQLGSPGRSLLDRMNKVRLSESPERSPSPQKEDALRDKTNGVGPAKTNIGSIDEEDENTDPKSERTGIPRTYPLTPSHTGRAAKAMETPASPVTPIRTFSRERDPGSPTIISRIRTPPSSPPKPYSVLPSTPLRQMSTGTGMGSPRSPWQKGAMPGSGTPMCAGCSKAVYFAEQVKAAGRVFHKPCLRCADCATSLDSKRMSEAGDKLVCNNCYSKNYGPKGAGYALLGKAGG